MSQKGFTYIAVLIVILVLLILLISFKPKFPINQPQPQPSSKPTNITLNVEYKNPFDSKDQYQNPFSDYQNPIDDLVFDESKQWNFLGFSLSC